MARPPAEPGPPQCKPDPTPSGAATEMFENLRPEPRIWCCRHCMAASKLQMLGDATAKCTQHGRLDRTQTLQLTAPAVPERELSVPAPVSAP